MNGSPNSNRNIDNSNNNNYNSIDSSTNINNVNSFSSISFEKLLREPDLVNEYKSKTIKDMQELALNHYQLFIENYKTLNFTVSKIQNVSNQIERGLLDSLPEISSSCENFSIKSHSIVERRASIKNLLDNFPTLLDILEIPQLIDTCIKNNSFDEALQLESFAKKIFKQYPNNRVIIDLMKEINTCIRTLISTLQQQLRQDISLTNCIKTIGYLRRLSIYKENELKIIFLHSRDQWLINSLKFDINSNHVTYLTKLTDSCRTNIFDIVTQFNAIFSNESQDEDHLDDLILYNWVQQKINIYISIIDSTLNQIKSGSSIAYVLENSMYFSMSLSRVGIDFRNILEPIFEKHILNNFVSQITQASHHFLETLKTYKFPITKSSSINNDKQQAQQQSSQSPTNSQQYISPPISILNHPPLAVLVNLILKAFNELKDCFPVSIKAQTTLKLKESIITIIGGVTSFYNQQLSNTISNFVNSPQSQPAATSQLNLLSGSFDKVFHSFCKCLAEDFIPFIVRCFEIICGNTQQQQQQQQQLDQGDSIDVESLVLSLKKIYLPESYFNQSSASSTSTLIQKEKEEREEKEKLEKEERNKLDREAKESKEKTNSEENEQSESIENKDQDIQVKEEQEEQKEEGNPVTANETKNNNDSHNKEEQSTLEIINNELHNKEQQSIEETTNNELNNKQVQSNE